MSHDLGNGKRVLVAPLDWGLGHAARCVPLVQILIQQGFQVFLAGEDKVRHLLKTEFPQLSFLHLPGYRVRYAAKGSRLAPTLLLQVPKIIKAIQAERRWLHAMHTRYRFDAVISDNRFGLYHPQIRTVFLTHQLRIKAPLRWVEAGLQHLNYRYIQQFTECWVPDFEEGWGLAGLLSHPQAMPAVPVRFIGPLSRFSPTGLPAEKKHLLILLSGPEPQRSVLEQLLLEQLSGYKKPVLFVRGLPGTAQLPPAAENVRFANHLPASALQQAIREASFVVARNGYSTVMDLMAMQQKGILIPTPGQTEQEYLAKHLLHEQYAFCVPQKQFRLQAALDEAAAFPYRFPPQNQHHKLQQAIAAFLPRQQLSSTSKVAGTEKE